MDFSLLEQMVSIPSTFPQEAQLAEFLYNELQRAGFSVVKQYAAEIALMCWPRKVRARRL